MTSGLSITLSSDLDRLDGSNEFLIKASNGACSNSQQLTLGPNEFQEFANQLVDFPQNINSRVKFELGGKEASWATYLLLEVFCYDPTGISAIKVVMESHSTEPYCAKSEFFICSYPAAINNLGKLLREWNGRNKASLEWRADE